MKQDDVLEIKFDQKNNRLEYSVNGESQGIAFENLPQQKYKLGITLGQYHDKVTLLDEWVTKQPIRNRIIIVTFPVLLTFDTMWF